MTNITPMPERPMNEARIETTWTAEYRMYEESTSWVEITCSTEEEARDWLDRWERGHVVPIARVVRSERYVVADWERPKD